MNSPDPIPSISEDLIDTGPTGLTPKIRTRWWNWIQNLTKSSFTPLYPITAAEVASGGTPTNLSHSYGSALRWGADPTGVADSTVPLQNWINAAWAMFQYQDGQGLWNGGGGAWPVLQLPPGKYRLTGTLYCPTGITLIGCGHPANTTNHTRLVMDSTGMSPGRTWSAGATIVPFGHLNAGNGFYYRDSGSGGVTGGSLPSFNTTIGSNTVDGSVTWVCMGPITAGDNRNKPMFKFRRGTLPSGGVLANAATNTTFQWLEMWYVTTDGSTFNNPASGAGIGNGDYPLGGILSFDVDATDFRVVECTFWNCPASVRIANVPNSSTTRGDGFTGNRGVEIFFEECEFDASAAHVVANSSYCDLVFNNCAFFGSTHQYTNCNGWLFYNNCRWYGGANLDASSTSNSFDVVQIHGGEWQQQNMAGSQIYIYGTSMVEIRDVTFHGSCTQSTITAEFCKSGVIANNSINDSGFNAPSNTGATAVAAIKLIDCQNMNVQGNNITGLDAAAYNGFGIYTISVNHTSQYNFVNGNCVTAFYNGAAYRSQDRYINLDANDVLGLNYNQHNTVLYPTVGQLLNNNQMLVGATTTGGFKGFATINAGALYQNGVQVGAGSVTSISPGSSHIVCTPNPITSTGTIDISLSASFAWTGTHTITPSAGTPLTITAVANETPLWLKGSTSTGQSFGLLVTAGTNASDSGLQVSDATNTRSLLAIHGDGAGFFSNGGDQKAFSCFGSLAVWGVTAPASKPTVSGSRGGNAALASFLTAMASYGFITDGSSP